jgi:hypothetical protein
MKIAELFLIIVIALIIGCSSDDSNQRKLTNLKVENTTDYANIFKLLDGTWQGKFYIYEDSLGQRVGKAQPKNISYKYFQSLPLRLKSLIEATHIYFSENPYLQKGEITDIYLDENGDKQLVKSTAINKVDNGKLKCIVSKPDETVIHDGEYLSNNTIAWHRNIAQPKRIEYFRETVDSLHYKIIGWGYYGNDDPALTPRTWFYADYIKSQ